MPLKPKILIVGSLPPPFVGPSLATQKLLAARNLQEAFQIQFLDISDRRKPENIGRLDAINALLGLLHAWQFLKILLLQRPQLVYIALSQGWWGYMRDLGFFIPAVFSRRKIVIHFRGSEFGSFYSGLPHALQLVTKWLFMRVTKVIVLGECLKLAFEELVSRDKIVVVPNGVNLERHAEREAWPRRETTMCPAVLYLSGLRQRKGVLRFIEALPMVLQKHPATKITIAGDWLDQDDRQRADELMALLRLNGQVHFIGLVAGARKNRIYAEHDIFVFPPLAPEGMPWVILEAMCAGLPVVSTNQGAISEVIEHERTGFIIEPTPDRIAAKICYLIENPAIARKMGARGRQRVATYFSENIYLKRMEEVFHLALGNSGATEATF